ncbi:phenylalanine--tRNA ligase subunit beta [Actinopolymorpha singaporensis]|uniref:Phenylalanine--tRNA ligase beta subunit n=1 Tax=Actinopolymorpha singaporensis TaxID=117157 RepID=A0A1H1W4D7_9ACTN|nr:phenylalanine--tRNA ligase subunit beta [Actinopolymorpha singaporensis]SDS92007.1 phenylalanyl-tRNA synthetase beta subunit [Actinopolymorpha singaporensis]
MRVPMSWLREHVDLPAGVSAREVADALIRAGLEVESVEPVGGDVQGPLTVGRVLEFAEEPQKNGKTIRWCQVDVGEGEPRGIVCGARNFAAGDLVVVALPGTTLPGDFTITARRTYGHVSDGMICSASELGVGDDHAGIMVLDPAEGAPGDDAAPILHLRDDVLDIAVTPDRGYTMSIRGVAREAATAFGVAFSDPVSTDLSVRASEAGYPVRVEDPAGCSVFAAVTVRGFDPAAPSPRWLARRVQLAGMRPISAAVDVTNYVMLELGQPIHGYDRSRLAGPIVVRRAEPGEKLQTLDGATRELDPEDLLITDDSGPIGLAGVMGGATTELSGDTRDVVIEAAHFDAVAVARTSRRHRLSSEASKRFERGVAPGIQGYAAQRVAELLVAVGGGQVEQEATLLGEPPAPPRVTLPADHPARVAGYAIPAEATVRRLREVGCEVEVAGEQLLVTPPSWRPDLTDPNDFAEEVIRLEGYDAVPSVLPVAPPGLGLSADQRLRRAIGRLLAGAGYVEVLAYPFVGEADLDRLRLPADDPRRRALALANPLSEEEPLLRTTLLPGLLAIARRNVGRGTTDLALFELGAVFRPRPDAPPAPRLPVDRRPADEQLAALNAALPDQPRRVAVVLTGDRAPAGWWGPARPAGWADAIEAARTVALAAGVELTVRADDHAPWHPGRCAALYVDDTLVGHAGELHPKVTEAYGLPARAAAMELEIDRLPGERVAVTAPTISAYPPAKEDVALVVDAAVPVAEVAAALREGAGPLLESVRLFDVYTGEQIAAGTKSLAFALRFRAPDRTLTEAEVGAAKQGAVDEAARRTGAVQRGA